METGSNTASSETPSQKLLFSDRCAASSTAEKTEGATGIAISPIPSAFSHLWSCPADRVVFEASQVPPLRPGW